MAIAEVNNDHADALLLNRIAYYGIGVAVPGAVVKLQRGRFKKISASL